MSKESSGIYHWKLGDVALARICQKTYARVRVVKDEKGLFYDDKVLGITGNEDGTITVTKELCYYVETCRTNDKFWLPYTCLHLAERSRPFYGTEKISPNKVVKSDVSPNKTTMPRKRKHKEEHVVALEVKLSKQADLNTTYDIRHMPLKQGRYDNAFKEFVRRGKERLFDEYFEVLKVNVYENRDALEYLLNVDASTEDKFEMTIKSFMTEKEVENYLHQCWKYNFVWKQSAVEGRELADSSNVKSPVKEAPTVHTPWCLVCGKGDKLRDCLHCPAAFHLPCRREWLLTILHRKNPPKKTSKPVTLVDKILSSTRTKCTVIRDKENHSDICPSCMWGPKVGYDDIVWNKLGPCPWWPARVLTPGELPSCLLARTHSAHDWPVRYYGTLNHAWVSPYRTCLLLPSHTAPLARDTDLKSALMDANDDYIAVYLK